ncbi:PAS domain-containing protein [Natrinema versiforme]|uniref:histidine kinase n=1 Tax=Natrinema versiforme JCM 10478 TaxID=1227496 RepID=L9YBD0_9EURY|nr:PAS domain-containing protein [Natrinema versiforme]ELY70941.1 multi-sensor signal transduction histidine kinase [Natrinema versiforme JCM 10478]
MAAADSSADSLRSRLRHREAVADLGRRALESPDLDGTLADTAAVVAETLEIDACSVLELRPDGDTAVLRAGVGWERGAVGSTAVSTAPESWAGPPLEEPKSVVTAAGRGDAEAEPTPLADAECVRRLGVTIGDATEPWGVLVGHSVAAREFGDHEADFLADIAALLESAIENERDHREDPPTDAVADGILETSPTGITVVGADGNVEFANERAAEILGRTRAEITALSDDDPCWDPRDESGTRIPPAELPFERVLERGEDVLDLEVNVRRPDGGRVWLSVNGSPRRTADGEVTSAVFAVEDVTDRKRLETESEAAFDRITDAFFGLDMDWTMTYVNERARELIDPDDEGLLGETLWEAFPEAVDSAFETEYRRAMETQEPTQFEAYFPPLETWFEVHAYPTETGLSVYFRDVSGRKATERELAETNRTLQRLYAITADGERTFNERVDDLLALGRERLGLEGGFLARIDKANDRFEVTHASGGTDGLRAGTVSSLSTAYCGRTIESDDLLAFTDSPLEHGIDEDAYDEWGLDSYLGGRILVDGDLYGTLCFEDESARSRPFTPAERSFVELATQWISNELERQAYQRDLAESEHRYRTLVEHFPNGIVALFDEDLEYTLAGGEILAEMDISVSEFVGQTVQERYEGETRETFETNFRAALEGEHRSFEFSLHGREWSAHAVPIEDEGDEVFAGMVMVQDVTEAKAKQRQLRERESRLERFKQYTDDVLDAIDDVFYVLDETGDLTRWNETLTEVTGYTDEEIASMHSLEFFGDEDATDITAAIGEAFETGHTRVEATIQTKDGTEVPYEFVASALENLDGEPVVTGIGRDVTAQREYERTLEGVVDDLEESNRRLEQFAYAASHDLQEPLRMVSSYLTLVERRYADELDADGEEFIEYAVDGATRMQEMIDGLLQYSRVDTQGDSFRPVDIDAVVADVLADLEVRIDETDAEIDIGSLPRVHGDPGQLRQLFQNLLDNAITYSGDGTPRISVFAEKDGARWMVSVRDRGIGIDPDDTDRIFRVFDRLHSHETYAGTGIGLALCQRIVERHDGEITVQSVPGEGTTFAVALPAVPDTDAEAATPLETDADTDGRTDE